MQGNMSNIHTESKHPKRKHVLVCVGKRSLHKYR